MKVENMTSTNGNKVANQFIITDGDATYFQSYDTIIVKTTYENGKREIFLDANNYNYSKTTAKYRNMFLAESTKEIESKIADGTYKLANLNQ